MEEEHFHLSKFKLGKMPDAIYENICKFLTLPNKKEEYYKDKIISNQPYRFGILKNMNINNFLHSILIINKIANSNLPSEIKKLFELNTDDKSIQASIIKEGLIKCIKNPELLNDNVINKIK